MRHMLHLIASCLIVLTFWSGTVAHAAEITSGAKVESGVHFEGDRDQVPADEHQSTPHHHAACDAHQIGIPTTLSQASPASIEAASMRATPARGLSSAEPDTALRPPIA